MGCGSSSEGSENKNGDDSKRSSHQQQTRGRKYNNNNVDSQRSSGQQSSGDQNNFVKTGNSADSSSPTPGGTPVIVGGQSADGAESRRSSVSPARSEGSSRDGERMRQSIQYLEEELSRMRSYYPPPPPNNNISPQQQIPPAGVAGGSGSMMIMSPLKSFHNTSSNSNSNPHLHVMGRQASAPYLNQSVAESQFSTSSMMRKEPPPGLGALSPTDMIRSPDDDTDFTSETENNVINNKHQNSSPLMRTSSSGNKQQQQQYDSRYSTVAPPPGILHSTDSSNNLINQLMTPKRAQLEQSMKLHRGGVSGGAAGLEGSNTIAPSPLQLGGGGDRYTASAGLAPPMLPTTTGSGGGGGGGGPPAASGLVRNNSLKGAGNSLMSHPGQHRQSLTQMNQSTHSLSRSASMTKSDGRKPSLATEDALVDMQAALDAERRATRQGEICVERDNPVWWQELMERNRRLQRGHPRDLQNSSIDQPPLSPQHQQQQEQPPPATTVKIPSALAKRISGWIHEIEQSGSPLPVEGPYLPSPTVPSPPGVVGSPGGPILPPKRKGSSPLQAGPNLPGQVVQYSPERDAKISCSE